MSLDARIQQSVVVNLSNRPAPVRVGPFVIGVDPTTASPSINYATPRPDAPITAGDVADLVAAFRAADRTPRLEYVAGCAPSLEGLLRDAGFAVEARHTYLCCRPSTLRTSAVPDPYQLRTPDTDELLAALIGAQNAAFGAEPVASPADVARVRRLQAAGGVAVMAVTGDECAGGGQAVPPADGVSEVAGIAVCTPHRRRGLAGAITADVTARLFASGVDLAWLEASGEDSWRVYTRVGYERAGERLYMTMT
ncbi:GNAT family N-acetyltransferase [Dactylosporangium sp. NPDC050588]|uniref:GNAT family N-acetyltransferase n=1 Tax=Dactylosporangium sp. NPDC050588 TaxID=3157211 RepID=UPI00340B1BE1